MQAYVPSSRSKGSCRNTSRTRKLAARISRRISISFLRPVSVIQPDPSAQQEPKGLPDGLPHFHLADALFLIVPQNERHLGDGRGIPPELQQDVHHAGKA